MRTYAINTKGRHSTLYTSKQQNQPPNGSSIRYKNKTIEVIYRHKNTPLQKAEKYAQSADIHSVDRIKVEYLNRFHLNWRRKDNIFFAIVQENSVFLLKQKYGDVVVIFIKDN